jgi:hypothetical protein
VNRQDRSSAGQGKGGAHWTLLPSKAAIDVPLALALIGPGLVIVIVPWFRGSRRQRCNDTEQGKEDRP